MAKLRTAGSHTERLRDGVLDVCHSDLDADDLMAELSRRMHSAVPFDSSMWLGTDPDTLLASWPTRVENMEPGHCAAFWQREFMVSDINLYRDLARATQPAAALHESTGGQLARSARYREFMAPLRYSDELRSAARVGQSTWGFVTLFRSEGRPPFSPDETELVASVSPAIGGALRSRWLGRNASTAVPSIAPGLLMIDGTGAVISVNETGEFWLEQLPDATSPDGLTLCNELWSVTARALASAEGHEHGAARLRIRSRDGQWLLLHASRLKGSRAVSGLVAVVIEPAPFSKVAPTILEAYGLSPRELDIAQALGKGFSTNEIAASLVLSPHTIRDHIKAVFEKVGVNSRGELVAKLFAEHYIADHFSTAQEVEV